ncbi:nucleotide sugar dehydrogenase [Coxiella burnetii]|uniref:UDP-N-acetyl-D-galactosamine 6-dehydrogenase n=3 Tax=Coxiella burnetii TaxID=777 RepID=Q83D93_COXBU|nr:nucleotide sugar dehydrogenase [Coxiella burnetii]NP_819865.1 UDP-N-acetyl-D-galactosamine 6-dehydrogenase [Coxiella burnetii RSA 493]AAO90379.1 UDP-N-acetyl-D-galactosamine 6-dehydrogenase [Coxiella burnetii RSA 493]ABS78401.1 UDP-N-acetyl-D-galactosamine 6-dehydrogenase [Coxiella burnetii Dugway 5J108-111]ACJ19969.1 UDP-N-acetyl-D-galactosamine 6-dehydrogenase [Coxiella burnetii CbuK_Q154]AIT62988.1 Nucleotide sugar dehydrogenase [Coxiella burnetii str. Namibia]AML49149.1 GDP-mannose deh
MNAVARKIAVIGLGYVGLPVAVAFSRLQPVIAYDKNSARIRALKQGYDACGEVDSQQLRTCQIDFTDDPDDLAKADFYIVAVPTPIDQSKHPDLSLLLNASETIGRYLKRGDIVVFESTVYPGVTEEECAPVLEKASGLKYGVDFTLGYSPERINPSDKTHRFETITKIVSGSDPETLDIVAHVYGSVITAGIYRAPSIRTAEAAKVIENTQRDLNIALMNELAIIFKRMDIDTQEVLAAAGTKWNFLPFKPGLVGGHCIGVDPYYLTYQAQRYGYNPQVILAGRRINDTMGKYIAEQTIKQMIHAGYTIKGAKVAVLGLTFKENCPDLRNSKVIDIIEELNDYGIECVVHDPLADPEVAKQLYNIDLKSWDEIHDVDSFVLAVAHDQFHQYSLEDYHAKLAHHSIIVDVKNVLNPQDCKSNGITLWRL